MTLLNQLLRHLKTPLSATCKRNLHRSSINSSLHQWSAQPVFHYARRKSAVSLLFVKRNCSEHDSVGISSQTLSHCVISHRFYNCLTVPSPLRTAASDLRNVRWKRTHRRETDIDDEASDEDDDDSNDDDDDVGGLQFDEDEGLPDKYKEVKAYLKSLRMDAVVAAGLNIGRNRVDELFLESRLKLNGERVVKKSKQLSAGDYVDLIASSSSDDDDEEGTVKFKRVRVLKVSSEATQKGKKVVHLRAWRSNITA